MIHALLQYAEDRNRVSKPGYTKKSIHWVLDFNDAGDQFLGLIKAVEGESDFENAPELGSKVKSIVALPEIKDIGGANSNFLIETLGKIAGRAQKEEDWAKAEREMTTFRWLLQQVSGFDPVFGTVAETLEKPECIEQIRTDVKKYKAKWTERATIRVGGTYLVKKTTWHKWWDTFRSRLNTSEKEDCPNAMVCFGTGQLVKPVGLHLGISRTKLGDVGASNDAPLITFDKDAFRSYNLGQNPGEYCKNAAMSEGAMKTYVEALRELLDKSVKLGGSRIAYWYTGPNDVRKKVESECDLIQELLGGNFEDNEDLTDEKNEECRILSEARLQSVINRIRKGGIASQLSLARFSILVLSADAGARIMIRDYVEGSFLDLVAAIERWANAVDIIGHTGRIKPLPPFTSLLLAPLREEIDESGQPYQKKPESIFKARKVSNSWLLGLWKAATVMVNTPIEELETVKTGWGLSIPANAISRALDLHTGFVQSGKFSLAIEKDSSIHINARVEWLSKTRLRLALLKAYLIRKGIPMNPALDPEHPSPAYHCGRLLAVFNSLQREALGDVGSGVIQRYYGGALTNPIGVFGQLSRMAQTHLSKLEGGLAHVYIDRIAKIHNGIRSEGDSHASYPQALTLNDQALFALGFWHQIAATNKEIADAAAIKKAKEETATNNNGIQKEKKS
ncbi:MAG TPA: type I-C CRISPR-associated protein Cas8c/Csd1 [Candidatus Hydrogenedentes bacterium]|nr:type I-C CRISPR-associated protein Cas8c/Csd1 [Candidatus Hydrogenedentota bacterium]